MKLINTNTYKKDRERDDANILYEIDQIFINKREFVVKMPEINAPVMACMSGGIDSIVNILFLLEQGYVVYPFWVDRGQSNRRWEFKAIDWYNKWFYEKYPLHYIDCARISLEVPSKSYKDLLRKTKHTEELGDFITYPARNPIMFLAGMEYAYALRSKDIDIKTLFVAEHADDFSVHGTLTLMRITNLMMCYLLQDRDFQFISIPIERELGNFYGKDRLVAYANEKEMPLEYTRSCCDASELQCGHCIMCCWDRRVAFKRSGVIDKTEYLNPMPASKEECRQDTAENWKGKK